MNPSPFLVDVAALRRRSGNLSFRETVDGDDLTAGERSVVGGRLTFAGDLVAGIEGVVVSGELSGTWRGPCRRCLEDVDGPLAVEVHEIFEDQPTEGETWPIEEERIDLEPLLRELALLGLPLAPLCRDSCDGPEPGRFPTGPFEEPEPKPDDRWAALDALQFDE